MWCDPHFAMFKVEQTRQGVRDDIQASSFVLNRKIVRLYSAIAHSVSMFNASYMKYK